VDTYYTIYDPSGTESELFTPGIKSWSDAGSTVVQLWDSKASCGGAGPTYEVGPAVLRPDGTVFATGADTCPGASGHTAIYDTATGTWSAGPDIPGGNDAADAPASILTSGHVLVETSPGYGQSPSTLYEFDGTKWLDIAQPTGLYGNSEGGRMLVMPTGNVMLLHVSTPGMWIYHANGTYQSAWQPTITSAPLAIYPGQTGTLSGTQLNGLTQGAAFGDDAQSATNYPLVRITNGGTGHVFYARTHDFSSMGVATGAAVVSTKFDVSTKTETGDSTLVVVANGIPSQPVQIEVKVPPQPLPNCGPSANGAITCL
jgi:hypothetical protein